VNEGTFGFGLGGLGHRDTSKKKVETNVRSRAARSLAKLQPVHDRHALY